MSGLIADTAVKLPAPALSPFVTQYAGFRASGLPSGVHFGLPSSCVDLIISLGHPIEVVEMPNSVQRPSALTALVSGLQDVPSIVRQDGTAFGLHVFIKPLGVRAILGVASAEIASLVLNLSDIWGKRAEDLVEMLLGADTWHQRFAILDRAFASKLNPTSPQPEISWSWRRLAKSHGSVPVQQLADEIGYSRRHFSERFRDAIGVAPKLAARVFRFERACRLIADHRLSLAQVAISCGYYDQAHLTHEWYAFAGCSPKAWMARELPFLQDYELGGSDNEWYDFESVHPTFL
jgi:AraC-like DNA-binding protein